MTTDPTSSAPATLYDRLIRHRYGTYRGLIRLWLARLEGAVGRLAEFRDPDWARVQRLVFVCNGNICRSAYAMQLARERGLPCASFGLYTETGAPSPEIALETAAASGHDMSAHRATEVSDFEVRDSDLILVTEVRQARRLAGRFAARTIQIALLGDWCRPRRPHLHDPFTLSRQYFETCFTHIESAVDALAQDWVATGAAARSGSAQQLSEHEPKIG
jgi:protein-tyrosine phosphatase